MTFYKSNMPPKLVLGWLMVFVLFFASSQIAAHSQRDPTLPPPLPKVGIASSGPVETLIGIESGAMTIIIRDGRPHLLIGSLFYTQGDTIGSVLIVRITKTEIWLSEGGILRKVPLFTGIQRRTVEPLAVDPYCVYSLDTPSSTTAPCVNLDP